jgi:rod shape-determining protein MreC
MESFFTRFRNVIVLTSVLMGQVILLAVQVKRPIDSARPNNESMSLLRFWVVECFIPPGRAIAFVGDGVGDAWRNYVDLRGMREQNQALQSQLDQLRLEEVGLAEDAGQARRLQALLAFKEKFISQTVAAQVIGTSGSEHSHVLYIDKGAHEGLKQDMAVITPRGIVGKVSKVFPNTAQVLEINDATAGAGVMLERSRLRGVLHGTTNGIPEILHIMADEKIETGEPVVSSGGDQIYPRGLPVGIVSGIAPDPEGGPFMLVHVKPAANLDKVEEVLVITRMAEKEGEATDMASSVRAADILAQRLPTIVPKPPDQADAEPPPTSVLYAKKPVVAPSANNPRSANRAPAAELTGTLKNTKSAVSHSQSLDPTGNPTSATNKSEPPKPASPGQSGGKTPQEHPQ